MIRPKRSCFNVSHVDRNLGMATLSFHRAGFCDYIYTSIPTLLFLCGDDDAAKACFSTFAVAA
jgi:hypothetical protein